MGRTETIRHKLALYINIYIYLYIALASISTLAEINTLPECRPSQKERVIIFQPSNVRPAVSGVINCLNDFAANQG